MRLIRLRATCRTEQRVIAKIKNHLRFHPSFLSSPQLTLSNILKRPSETSLKPSLIFIRFYLHLQSFLAFFTPYVYLKGVLT